MDKQVREDFERCLPRAQELYKELIDSSPFNYAMACRYAFQDAPSEDIYAAVILPQKLAEIKIAARIAEDAPEETFTSCLQKAFRTGPQQIMQMPIAWIALVTRESEEQVTSFLTGVGYRVAEGMVVHHDSMETDRSAMYIEKAREAKKPLGPRP